MSTSTFPFNDPGICPGGVIPAITTVAGRAARAFTAWGCQQDFVATGTDCSVTIYSTVSQALTVVVDGGTATTITMPALSTWGAATLFSGLSDAAHTVTLKGPNTTTNYSVDSAAFLSVTGASPSLALPSGLLGPDRIYPLRTGAMAPYVAASPSCNASGQHNYTCFNLGDDGEIDLPSGSFETLKAWCYLGTGKVRLRVDGVLQSITSIPNQGKWGWATLATGLDATGTHNYSIHVANSVDRWIYALMAIGGSGFTGTTPAVAKPVWVFYGDSITASDGTNTGNDTTLGFPAKVAWTAGVWPVNLGIGGTKVSDSGTVRYAGVAGLSANVGGTTAAIATAKVINLYGTNDMTQGYAVADFEGYYRAMVESQLGVLPAAAHVYNLAILDRGVTSPAELPAWRAAQRAAAEATGTAYVPTDGWIDSSPFGASGYDTTDALHPSAQGYDAIVARLLPVLTGVKLRSAAHAARRRAG